MKFAPEAWPFVIPWLLLAVAAYYFSSPRLAMGLVVVAIATLLFFRDPPRAYTGPKEVIVAPADGLVTGVDEVEDPAIGPGRFRRVVTFLSVFDVHVQRIPIDGEVVTSQYKPGRKVAAFREDAGEINEHHLSVLRTETGDLVGVRQIAGLLARRVVSDLEVGQVRTRGERLGVIKFGSRVDLMVPLHYEIQVERGQRLKNGQTVAAIPGTGTSASKEAGSWPE